MGISMVPPSKIHRADLANVRKPLWVRRLHSPPRKRARTIVGGATSWTQSCGLATTRQSSLEGRLTPVISCGRNRRGVTRILAVAAVVVAVAAAIPQAILRASELDR